MSTAFGERLRNREKLGELLKRHRKLLGLKQADVARLADVQPSYIAYLEKGRRRPGLALLRRLADILGIKCNQLVFLAYPEIAEVFKQTSSCCSAPRGQHRAWKDFTDNKALLACHKVSPQELKVLSAINTLGEVSGSRQFLFVLKTIRCALEDE